VTYSTILLLAVLILIIAYTIVSSITTRRRREIQIRDWALEKGCAVIRLTSQASSYEPALWERRGLFALLSGKRWIAELQDEEGGVFTAKIIFKGGRMEVSRV